MTSYLRQCLDSITTYLSEAAQYLYIYKCMINQYMIKQYCGGRGFVVLGLPISALVNVANKVWAVFCEAGQTMLW